MAPSTRPAVLFDPGRQFGEPRIDGSRVTVKRLVDAVWAGATAAHAADQLGVRRRDVLVACWFVTQWSPTDYHRRLWRKRWGAWAAEHRHELERDDLRDQVPDPPSPNRRPVEPAVSDG